jgi:hypothetical protein
MPDRPFVLVGQQYLADPQRSAGAIHPVYSYAHVPHGYAGDATAAIIAQIERFAPGFRDRIVGQASIGPASFAAGNPNFAGGDIITGAKDARQLVLGPRATLSPYDLGVPGVFADRLPRRAVMLTADGARMTIQAATAALLLSHTARVWELVVLQASANPGPGGAGHDSGAGPGGRRHRRLPLRF